MLYRQGLRAVVFCAVAAGLLFRAEGAFASSLTTDTFSFAATASEVSSETIAIALPEFSLLHHYVQAHYLASNREPDFMVNVPPQDLFTYSSSLAARWDASAIQHADAPAWDTLWHNVKSIPLTAVPEPTTTALVMLGGALLLRRKK